LPGGFLGGEVDVSGYTWASLKELNSLVNSYIGSDILGPGLDRYEIHDSFWAPAFIADFGLTGLDAYTYWASGTTRDKPDSDQRITFNVYDTIPADNRTSSKDWVESQLRDTAGSPTTGGWFWRPLDQPVPEDDSFTVRLEEPIDGDVHTGIGLVRGWAVANDKITKVEIFIDGSFAFEVPFGGARPDVEKIFPDVQNSGRSGFAMAYGFSNLEPGSHTFTARIQTAGGKVREAASRFEVDTFHKPYIEPSDGVDTTYAHAELSGDEITLREVEIDGRYYDMKIKWRPFSQGFEIIEIR